MPAFDAVIIGGGPAGLAAAIALHSKGMRALVADCATPPVDKTCGEGVMPNGVLELKKIGLDLSTETAGYFSGIRFVSGTDVLEGRFPAAPGIAIRRTCLHHQLLAHAESLGINMQWGAKRIAVEDGICRMAGESIRADYIVGADGQNSMVRRAAGLDACRHDSFRYGFRQHFHIKPWSEFVEVYWGRGKQIYVAPVSKEESGIAVLTTDPGMRVRQAIDCFPALRAKLASCAVSTRETGALTRNRRLLRVSKGRFLLIGDASGSVDAVTGEGMSLAFLQASALADSLAAGAPHLYERRHAQLFRIPRIMARLLLLFSEHDRLRRHVFHAASGESAVFAKLLALHVGPPPAFHPTYSSGFVQTMTEIGNPNRSSPPSS